MEDQANVFLQEIANQQKQERIDSETQLILEEIEDKIMNSIGPRAFGPDQ